MVILDVSHTIGYQTEEHLIDKGYLCNVCTKPFDLEPPLDTQLRVLLGDLRENQIVVLLPRSRKNMVDQQSQDRTVKVLVHAQMFTVHQIWTNSLDADPRHREESVTIWMGNRPRIL